MTRFIPKNKLGKKARRQLDNQRRNTWPIPPATKKIESKKQFNRKRNSHDYLGDWNHGSFTVRQTSARTLGQKSERARQ